MERLINHSLRLPLQANELLHRGFTTIRSEDCLSFHPVGTLLGYRSLRELVPQLDLELAAVEAPLSLGFWNVEFTSNFFSGIGDLVGNEGRRREDEFEG